VGLFSSTLAKKFLLSTLVRDICMKVNKKTIHTTFSFSLFIVLSFLLSNAVHASDNILLSFEAIQVPVIDGVLSENEWNDAYMEIITLSSTIGEDFTPVTIFIKNDNENIYFAFNIHNQEESNLMGLRFGDNHGLYDCKNYRWDQTEWDLFYNGSDWIGDSAPSAEHETSWVIYDDHHIIEWKIPLVNESSEDISVLPRETIRFQVRYGLEDRIGIYPKDSFYLEFDTWGYLVTSVSTRGPQGLQGDPGIQGPQGVQGIQGDQGSTGNVSTPTYLSMAALALAIISIIFSRNART